MENLEKPILKVIDYFSFFSYPPTGEEIYTFLPIKTTRKALENELHRLVKSKKLISQKISNNLEIRAIRIIRNSHLYTLPPHSIFFQKRADRAIISQKKLKKISPFIRLLSRFPQIKLIGLSGSAALNFAAMDDDVDIFIITANYRLWMGRFLSVLLAFIMGLKRKKGLSIAPNKLCLNLFFDGTDLTIPPKKRNLYTAHEVLQMKPAHLLSANGIFNFPFCLAQGGQFSTFNSEKSKEEYKKFLAANQWVFEYFPNHHSVIPAKAGIHGLVPVETGIKSGMTKTPLIESILRAVQLRIINRHRTTEIITDTQLWFHPNDFEKKLRQKGIVRG